MGSYEGARPDCQRHARWVSAHRESMVTEIAPVRTRTTTARPVLRDALERWAPGCSDEGYSPEELERARRIVEMGTMPAYTEPGFSTIRRA
jgi:hypothetical protein